MAEAAAATVPPDEPTPPPPQSGCSCQDRRLELQVRWPAATARLSAREEAGPPLESFTRSSFPLHLSPGSAGSAALAPLLSRPLSDYNAALFAACTKLPPVLEAWAFLLNPPAPQGPAHLLQGTHRGSSMNPGCQTQGFEKARSCPKEESWRSGPQQERTPEAAGSRQSPPDGQAGTSQPFKCHAGWAHPSRQTRGDTAPQDHCAPSASPYLLGTWGSVSAPRGSAGRRH